ncbi:hypothetical protein VCHA48P439_70172 [Vibrio chagasii]|nr:hypothetical protein VCHA34P117_70172 [Vibrio chagasii]CAH7144572.1 hypothetical protein VCHA40O237_20214 [Vibrio chagasii]CAH7320741.1 hypothetical protein VCHA48P439_70172 [Vibrio chagasii]CAH7347210.1 hypothetical protein VCHA40O236_70172 [Vibrio chagasii]CAH7400382.1 hypothetical protein VCHA55O508_20214 [Vibrio chagasii]
MQRDFINGDLRKPIKFLTKPINNNYTQSYINLIYSNINNIVKWVG